MHFPCFNDTFSRADRKGHGKSNFVKFLAFMLVFCLLGKGIGELLITLAMMHYYQPTHNQNQLFIIKSQTNASLGTLIIKLKERIFYWLHKFEGVMVNIAFCIEYFFLSLQYSHYNMAFVVSCLLWTLATQLFLQRNYRNFGK